MATLFHNFLSLPDLPQKILFAIFYHSLPVQNRTVSSLFIIVQAFEHGLITVYHDKDRERLWVEPMKNKDFMFFIAKRVPDNLPLQDRAKELYDFVKKNEIKVLKNKPQTSPFWGY